MTEVSFGEWLKRQRSGRGLTQEQLAQQIGCAAITLRKIESEERRPSAQIVERLAEILTIPPSEHATFLRFARGDPTKAPGESIAEAPWRVETDSTTAPASISRKPSNNLPAQLTSFIGREKEIEEIKQAIDQYRLVTLTGSGGTGKTRLSLRVAEDLLENFGYIWFVELAPISNPDSIPQTVLSAMGLREQQGKTAEELISEYLRDKNTLIVLDNCEHLIEVSAKIAFLLLNQTPGLKILASSREALGVTGEMTWQVPSLSQPDPSRLPELDELSRYEAIRLFCDRAALAKPNFAATKVNAAYIAQICFRLDGIPLALELAASRVKALTVEQIAARLDDRFRLLTGGARTALPRQQTLRAAIDWSYNLLSEPEQSLLRSLGVFSGGWTLDAAERVCDQEGSASKVLDLLTQLVDKSLVSMQEVDNIPRYHMLETTRHHAREKLLDSGETESVHNHHLSYFLDLAEKADMEIHGPDQVGWFDQMEGEHDNFLAALEWCVSEKNTEPALRLLGALEWTWRLRSHYHETRSWFKIIRDLPDIAEYPAAYARLLARVGRTSWLAGAYQDARGYLEESGALCRDLGDEADQDLAEALDFLGMVELDTGNLNKAESLFNEGLGLYQKWDNGRGAAETMHHLGHLEEYRRNETLSLAWYERSLDLFEQRGDSWGIARVSKGIGQLYLRQGEYRQAKYHFNKQLEIDEHAQFKYGVVNAMSSLGEVHRYQGDFRAAEIYYQKSLAMAREYGLAFISNPLYGFSLLALHQNDYVSARERFIQLFQLERKEVANVSACNLFVASAAIAAGTAKPELAAKLYGAAQAIFVTFDYRIPAFDEKEFDRHIQIARDQLGEAVFKSIETEGRSITVEQAIRYALES